MGLFNNLRFFTVTDLIGAIIDIAIISYLLYRFFLLIRGTRAVNLLKGLVVLLIATTLSQWFRLYTINWLLVNARTMLFVALPVVFQPELRRALEQIGRGKIFSHSLFLIGEEDRSNMINELVRACENLSKNKVGALIVIERDTGLRDFIETGIMIEGLVSAEFLVNIFIPNTPLHDGAVIIRGNRVMAAACFLPLTESEVSFELGSRHRAALGITEHSDAVCVVVSEETGSVSLANGGKLIRNIEAKTLAEMLITLFQTKPVSAKVGGIGVG